MEQFNPEAMIAQAKTFAKTLATSQEFQRFYAAQDQFNQDQAARTLLETFQAKQREFQEARMKNTAMSGTLVTELQHLQKQVQQNTTIITWAITQQEAIRLIQDANQAISTAAGFDFGQTLTGAGSC